MFRVNPCKLSSQVFLSHQWHDVSLSRHLNHARSSLEKHSPWREPSSTSLRALSGVSPPYTRDTLDLTFRDTKQAYKSKTTAELLRAVIVLYISSFDTLVYNHAKVKQSSVELSWLPITLYVHNLKTAIVAQMESASTWPAVIPPSDEVDLLRTVCRRQGRDRHSARPRSSSIVWSQVNSWLLRRRGYFYW